MLVEATIQIEEFAPVTNASLRLWSIKELFVDSKDATSEEVCLVFKNKMKFDQSVKQVKAGVTVYGKYIEQGKLSIKLSHPFQRVIMISNGDPAQQKQQHVYLGGQRDGEITQAASMAQKEYLRLFLEKRHKQNGTKRFYDENEAIEVLENPSKMSKKVDNMDLLVQAHRRALVTIKENNGSGFQPMRVISNQVGTYSQSTVSQKKEMFESKYDALLDELLEIGDKPMLSDSNTSVVNNSNGMINMEHMVQVNEPWKRDLIPPSELATLSAEQKQVFELVLNGYNVFFTGPAGCGKSLVLSLQRRALNTGCLMNQVFFTSTTGITAVNLQGCTVWHWLGGNLGGIKDTDEAVVANVISRIQRNRDAHVRVRNTKQLLVDEISLLAGVSLQRLDAVLRKQRGNNAPMGGIQCIFSGDFFQLPPVEGSFAFASTIWYKLFQNEKIILQRVFRQSDDSVIDAQNLMRWGKPCVNIMQPSITRGYQLDLIEKVMSQQEITVTPERSPQVVHTRIQQISVQTGLSSEVITQLRDTFLSSTRLYTKKNAVTVLNSSRLAALPGKVVELTAVDNGSHPSLLESLPVDAVLRQKQHAQVMLVKNISVQQGLCNGARGIVIGFTGEDFPIVQFQHQHNPVTIKPESFPIIVAGKMQAERTMVPLCLAWALSIHKSQGATLDSVIVDLKGTFECGQAYVALSRVRDFQNLAIVGYTDHCVRAHPSVQEFYK